MSIALRIWPRDANRRREILRIAIAAGLALLIVSGYRTAYAKGVGHIEFIDVGQGIVRSLRLRPALIFSWTAAAPFRSVKHPIAGGTGRSRLKSERKRLFRC